MNIKQRSFVAVSCITKILLEEQKKVSKDNIEVAVMALAGGL